MINMFSGDSKIFNSFDQAMDDTNNNYLEEFLNTLLPNSLPPHKLILKNQLSDNNFKKFGSIKWLMLWNKNGLQTFP
ncbi:hypothetical protein V6Z11_A02G054300 [Gossypium hirsutum]